MRSIVKADCKRNKIKLQQIHCGSPMIWYVAHLKTGLKVKKKLDKGVSMQSKHTPSISPHMEQPNKILFRLSLELRFFLTSTVPDKTSLLMTKDVKDSDQSNLVWLGLKQTRKQSSPPGNTATRENIANQGTVCYLRTKFAPYVANLQISDCRKLLAFFLNEKSHILANVNLTFGLLVLFSWWETFSFLTPDFKPRNMAHHCIVEISLSVQLNIKKLETDVHRHASERQSLLRPHTDEETDY